MRTSKPGIEVPDGSPEQGLSFGTLPARAMEGLQVVLGSLYQPMVELESKAWKAGVGVDDSTRGKSAAERTESREAALLITIENRDDLGEWLGHCQYDKEGKPRKVKGTSSVAIRHYGEETEALTFVLNYIKERRLAD